MSVPEQNSQAQPIQASDKEYNFAQLRKQLEQEKQARLQSDQRLAQIEEERARPRQEDVNDDDSDEPYVDKKTLNKKLMSWEKALESKFDKKAEEKARELVEQERQSLYLENNKDFNDVLKPELIQKFAEAHPGLAKAMLKMPDNFERQQLLYENIKSLGINKPPAPKEDIQAKIDANRRSPYYQPSAAAGAPPYASVGDFSQAGQKNAYDNMKKLINNRRALS